MIVAQQQQHRKVNGFKLQVHVVEVFCQSLKGQINKYSSFLFLGHYQDLVFLKQWFLTCIHKRTLWFKIVSSTSFVFENCFHVVGTKKTHWWLCITISIYFQIVQIRSGSSGFHSFLRFCWKFWISEIAMVLGNRTLVTFTGGKPGALKYFRSCTIYWRVKKHYLIIT